jgi:dienelactone hydrolase
MVGYLAFDEERADRMPAVLVSHEGPGLGRHPKEVARRLAALGYVAFALDYHGGGELLAMPEAMERLGELMADPSQTGRLAIAGLDVLLSEPKADPGRVAAIGFCFGGVVSLELARTGGDLLAVVGFHPGYTAPRTEASKKIRGSVLMLSGTEDPFATADQRAAFETEMRDAGVADWRMELYGGVGHSFTNPDVDTLNLPGMAYDARADKRSWDSMIRLFDEVLCPL